MLRPQKSCSLVRNIIMYRFNYTFSLILLHVRSPVKRNLGRKILALKNVLNACKLLLTTALVLFIREKPQCMIVTQEIERNNIRLNPH